MRSLIESGAELFARLTEKPSLRGLEETLFVEGLRNTDIIEITGPSSTGKTLLLTQMLAKCLLPAYHRTVLIGGLGASALLINTDHHFQTLKLIDIMENIVRIALGDRTVGNKVALKDEVINEIVQDSLRNLHIINCYEYEQFFLTICTLDDAMLRLGNLALLAIDGIAAYYWQVCETTDALSVDSHVKKLLERVNQHASRFNVATIYTRPEVNTHYWNKSFANINYKIHLRKLEGSKGFVCTLKSAQEVKQINYEILSRGIAWRK